MAFYDTGTFKIWGKKTLHKHLLNIIRTFRGELCYIYIKQVCISYAKFDFNSIEEDRGGASFETDRLLHL